MFYLIYKITNIINNKVYIGCHKTNNINDGYMGSGVYIRNAIAKHGIENFSKEILFFYDNSTDMLNKEAELVNQQFLETNTYNLNLGGTGSFEYINSQKLNNKVNQCSLAGKASAAKGGGFKGKTHSEKTKKILSETLTGRPAYFAGKTHSEETKRKMRQSHIGKGTGEKNSQFGSCWVTNGIENKKINKDNLNAFIESGYKLGRIVKRKCQL